MESFTISFTNILIWAFFGMAVGLITHVLDHTSVVGGSFATIVIGCASAVTSGYLTSLLLGIAMRGFSIEGFLYALIGALFFTLFYRISFRRRNGMLTGVQHVMNDKI